MKPRRRGRQSSGGRADNVDETLLRRIGWQLAALTGVLFLALLLAMGSAVYIKARDALLQPVRQSVVARASQEDRQAAIVLGGPNCPHNSSPDSSVGCEPSEDGVYLTRLGPELGIVVSNKGGPNGSNGRLVPDIGSARQVLTTGVPTFSTTRYNGGTYLVYTVRSTFHPPGRVGGPFGPGQGSSVTGVIQTSASESGYLANISAINRILVIVGFLGIIAAVLITVFVVQRALQPIRLSLLRQRNFVADAAHELRTPLTIIRSVAEMAIRSDNDEEQDFGEVTLKETAHLTKLVNDLSFLARSDTGNLDVERKPVDLQAIVSDVAMDMVMLAEEREVRVETNFSSPVQVMGDRVSLRQLLLILLDNALKYSPDGGMIEIRLERNKRTARLFVRDSGPGIPPEEMEHVFDRFYRASSSREGDGTGLGLAIAQSIVRSHHGDIVAANAKSGGAVFIVTLPMLARTGSATPVRVVNV